MKYKIGDKVLIINNDYGLKHFLKIGSIGTVTYIHSSNSLKGAIGVDGKSDKEENIHQIVSKSCVKELSLAGKILFAENEK